MMLSSPYPSPASAANRGGIRLESPALDPSKKVRVCLDDSRCDTSLVETVRAAHELRSHPDG